MRPTKPSIPSLNSERARKELRDRFGHPRLRAGQRPVIERVLSGKNTLAVMPTGAGKSLCYQLPACLLPGMTIVVSPLLALIADQHAKLVRMNVSAVQLHSGLTKDELQAAEALTASGEAKIVFVTPERLVDSAFLEIVRRHSVSLLVVDEAHCISQWGEDFRPAYGEMGAALQALKEPPVLALTATATDQVIADIAEQLHIPKDGRLLCGSYRANLRLAVESFADDHAKQSRAVAILSATEGPAIAYAATIQAAESLHETLVAAGIPALLYHGRLPAPVRREAQRQFFDSARPVMVATNAFGLGIDKPNIRLVLHVQMPPSLDSYYQEAGRAGRDGEPASCLLPYRSADRAVQQFFINGRYPSKEDGELLWDFLNRGQPVLPGWSLAELKHELQRPLSKLRVLVNWLRRNGWVSVDGDGRIQPTPCGPTGTEDLNALLDRFVSRGQDDRTRLEHMVFYGQTGGCRWRVLLDGLGESAAFDRCGHCDNCLRIAAHQRLAAQIEPKFESIGTTAASPAQIAIGEPVRVRRYGLGVTIESSAESITVEFADGEKRCFDPSYVNAVRSTRSPRARQSLMQGQHAIAEVIARA